MKGFSVLTLVVVLLCQPVWAESKTNVKKGLLIGGLSGTAVGFGTSFAIGQKYTCNANQKAQAEPCSLPTIITVSGTIGGAAIGTGIGALIGSLIPKKQNLSVLPLVTHDDKLGTMGGLLLSKRY
ncbi:MAG TPA: hypothetical protein VJC18_00725 [bacterium]|nr:hypothetical protein [bacterium]